MTRTRFSFVAMAALAVAVGMPMQVHANWYEAVSSACSQSYRIDHTEVDCLHGWWNNNPPASSGVGGGATFGVQSHCSRYGTVVASVDIVTFRDYRVYLDSSTKWRDAGWWLDVRNITCCIDRSDLCYRNQVEAWRGLIRVYENGGFSVADVSTQAKRYEFCRTRPDNVYCKNDPEGDAHVRAYDQGDCVWHWEQSHAGRRRCEATEITYDGSRPRSPRCTVEAVCNSEDGPVETEITALLWDIDELFFCHATDNGDRGLQVGLCPEEPGVVVN